MSKLENSMAYNITSKTRFDLIWFDFLTHLGMFSEICKCTQETKRQNAA